MTGINMPSNKASKVDSTETYLVCKVFMKKKMTKKKDEEVADGIKDLICRLVDRKRNREDHFESPRTGYLGRQGRRGHR